MEDRRSDARHSLVMEARFQDRHGTILKGRVTSLGMGGTYVDTAWPLDPNSLVRLTMDVAESGKIVYALGQVVRVLPGRGMAVEFKNKNSQDVRMTLDMLGRLKRFAPLKCQSAAAQV